MAKPLHGYRAVRAEGGGLTDSREQLAVERPLKVLINGEVFTILMQLPGGEIDLVTGLLFRCQNHWRLCFCTSPVCGLALFSCP